MNGTNRERWLAMLLLGYAAWVLPYNLRQYTSFLEHDNPIAYTSFSVGMIFLVCASLTVVLFLAGKDSPVKLALHVAIPWLLVSLLCDFGLATYYNGWEPDFLSYGLGRAWHFIFVPLGALLAGFTIPLIWKEEERTFTPAHSLPRYRK